jgi:hypothetical protein
MSSSTASQKGKGPKKITAIDAEMQMKGIAGGLTGALENFHLRQREIEKGGAPDKVDSTTRYFSFFSRTRVLILIITELKVDAEGLAEVENELYKLNKKRKSLEERLKKGREWLVRAVYALPLVPRLPLTTPARQKHSREAWE